MDSRFITLNYRVSEDEEDVKSNRENIAKLQEYLEDAGVLFSFPEESRLMISLHMETYEAFKTRNAGRHKRNFTLPQSLRHNPGRSLCMYSDIIFLKQTKTDQEICELTGIPSATFSRHKKALYNSPYYKNLDLNRLNDRKYLESRPLNRLF